MRLFEKRDEDKIKTDKAKNEFESIIYSMRSWLNDEDNNPYIDSKEQDSLLSKLIEEEEWLLDGEGEHADHLEYIKRYTDLESQFKIYRQRK